MLTLAEHLLFAPSHQKIEHPNVNKGLFEYSIETLSNYGYKLNNISLDLHNSDFENNVETEYERKFSNKGLTINRLEARK